MFSWIVANKESLTIICAVAGVALGLFNLGRSLWPRERLLLSLVETEHPRVFAFCVYNDSVRPVTIIEGGTVSRTWEMLHFSRHMNGQGDIFPMTIEPYGYKSILVGGTKLLGKRIVVATATKRVHCEPTTNWVVSIFSKKRRRFHVADHS